MIQTWTRLYNSHERQYEIFPTIHMIREVDPELAHSVGIGLCTFVLEKFHVPEPIVLHSIQGAQARRPNFHCPK